MGYKSLSLQSGQACGQRWSNPVWLPKLWGQVMLPPLVMLTLGTPFCKESKWSHKRATFRCSGDNHSQRWPQLTAWSDKPQQIPAPGLRAASTDPEWNRDKPSPQTFTQIANLVIYFLKICIYLFLESWEGREKEEWNTDVWEIHWLVASCTLPTGDLAHNTGMCPD